MNWDLINEHESGILILLLLKLDNKISGDLLAAGRSASFSAGIWGTIQGLSEKNEMGYIKTKTLYILT